jgi:DnaJ-class molecular chaperone
MTDPYEVLNLPPDADDEAIRRRYLELVRQFTPEHHPEKFAAIRQAYEDLKDLTTRLRRRVFDVGEHESIQSIIEELACRSPRRRVSLATLLEATRTEAPRSN